MFACSEGNPQWIWFHTVKLLIGPKKEIKGVSSNHQDKSPSKNFMLMIKNILLLMAKIFLA